MRVTAATKRAHSTLARKRPKRSIQKSLLATSAMASSASSPSASPAYAAETARLEPGRAIARESSPILRSKFCQQVFEWRSLYVSLAVDDARTLRKKVWTRRGAASAESGTAARNSPKISICASPSSRERTFQDKFEWEFGDGSNALEHTRSYVGSPEHSPYVPSKGLETRLRHDRAHRRAVL